MSVAEPSAGGDDDPARHVMLGPRHRDRLAGTAIANATHQKGAHTMDTGLLVIRLVLGLAVAAHGAQKLFGLFGGYGIAGTGGFFETLGFRPGKLFAVMAGTGELVGGLGLALGLLTPFASALIVATMVVAILGVHFEHGFFAQDHGYEYPLTVAATALGMAFTGAGRVSLDAALGLPLTGASWGLMALGLGLLGALPPLLARATSVRHGTGESTATART